MNEIYSSIQNVYSLRPETLLMYEINPEILEILDSRNIYSKIKRLNSINSKLPMDKYYKLYIIEFPFYLVK